MTRPFKQIVVLQIIILQLLIHVNGSPYTPRDFVSLFANPVKDFIKLFTQANNSKSAVYDKYNSGNVTKDRTGGKMIEVPENNGNTCNDGTVKDINGLCRSPWS
ncbi:jg8508 [Pararge aegeria aegeria]|uniref:Jg8508 protein n=1 Tax=Pararge aegeria aegeria TaxID=348720 RepID=A0A8S4RCZ9_9NEOP|nr:jg8508 [Pararge aegeria aegeria]